ncbi:MAG: type II secretion system F family protein [Formosimonas sp.]
MNTTQTIIRFTWHGQNRAGQILSGVLYGVDKNSIRAQLAQRGIVAQRIYPSREPWRRPIKKAQVTRFLQELTTLYDAGVPLLRIFDVLLHSQRSLKFRAVIQSLRLDVERGESFHMALRHHPLVFDDLTCNLVESGETAGRLSDTLRNITYTQERRLQLSSQIKTALAYPSFVVVVAVLVWVVILGWVVPVFEGIYKNAHQQLPWLTQLLLDLSHAMRTQGVWWLLFGVLGVWWLKGWENPRWRYALDHSKMRLPVFGEFLKTAWHAQFSRVLGLLYQSGVPLHQALTISARTIDSLPMRQAIDNCTRDVLNGHSLSMAMAQYDVFETNLIQRVQIGEESGTLTDMLAQHATHNEFLVEQTIKRLSSLIEPFLILLIGLMVTIMLVALYLPILNLGTVLR